VVRFNALIDAALSRLPIVVVHLILGLACGFFWFVAFFLLFAARMYIAGKAGGIFYLDVFFLKLVILALSTFWILPLMGAVAALKWPVTSKRRGLRQQLPGGNQPVLILVHGTFASSVSDEGGAWWQIGGTVHQALEKRAPGAFAYLAFHWSGANLESARRDAAQSLSSILRQLEEQARPYHLVAHSHGGNVVWQAFLRCTSAGHKLRYLRGWTTLGSPFFSFQTRSPQLWHVIPLAVFGALFLRGGSAMTTVWTRTNSMWSVFESFEGGVLTPIIVDALIVVTAAVGALLAFDLLLRLTGVVRNRVRNRRQAAAYKLYGGLHHAMYSSVDEAINGLGAVVRLDASRLRLVPAAPYFNEASWGKFFSPLTFPFAGLWNLIMPVPLNSWVCSLLKDKMHGNDVRGSEVAAVSHLPLPGTTGASLSAEEEAELRTRTSASAGATLSLAQESLGIFAAGSSVSVAFQQVGPNSLGALVHTSYFASQQILDSICESIVGDGTAVGIPSDVDSKQVAELDIRLLVSRLAFPQTVLLSLAFFMVWLIVLVLYQTGIVPRTTSARLAAMVNQNLPAGRLSRGREARIWYAALCGSGRCADAAPGYHFEVQSVDNLESMVDLIRWQAACKGSDCKLRDSFLEWTVGQFKQADPMLYIKSEQPAFERRIDMAWLAVSRLAALKQVPDIFSNEVKAVTEFDKLNEVGKLFDAFSTRLADRPSELPPDLRSLRFPCSQHRRPS
jgi:hypothetical protein